MYLSYQKGFNGVGRPRTRVRRPTPSRPRRHRPGIAAGKASTVTGRPESDIGRVASTGDPSPAAGVPTPASKEVPVVLGGVPYEETRLTDFGDADGGSEDDGSDEDGDADAGQSPGTDADRAGMADGPDGGDAATADPGPTADTDPEEPTADAGDQPGADRADAAAAPPTATWRPDGGACDACGSVVQRRWRDGGTLVCVDCVDW